MLTNIISKLLYVWHKKKENSGHSGWGLVAPIALDTQSGAQRTRASETIHAYCENHSLHLVSLVVLSPHPETSAWNEATSYRDQSPEIIASKRRSDRDLTEALMWGDIVSQSIKGPLLLVQDYVEMLTEASGRVIVISTCPEHCSQCEPDLLSAAPLFISVPPRVLDSIRILPTP